jgi:hypothetical protein
MMSLLTLSTSMRNSSRASGRRGTIFVVDSNDVMNTRRHAGISLPGPSYGTTDSSASGGTHHAGGPASYTAP